MISVNSLLFVGRAQSQTEIQASSKLIVDDSYNHAEMSVNTWGGSHGLFFGSKVNYSGSGNLWDANNTVYAQDSGPFSYGAFSMGFLANGGRFGFYDGGGSTGIGNAITWNPIMIFNRGGNVGIGTTNPQAKLEVAGAGLIKYNSSSEYIFQHQDLNGNMLFGLKRGSSATTGNDLLIRSWDGIAFSTNNSENVGMRIDATGNVNIGTTAPSHYKLAVEGTIGARKLKITQVTPWPDYVFDSTYTLQPLTQVEQFIKDNKHLPDVPSAKEVANKGLDVGDNQALLLKKIEELTLYIIEQNKKLEAQNQKNTTLEKRLVEIEKMLAAQMK
jgi:hypothetical protein